MRDFHIVATQGYGCLDFERILRGGDLGGYKRLLLARP